MKHKAMNWLENLSEVLDADETDALIKWIVTTLQDIGMEHDEMCLMNRPHSHSADCDCGIDELQKKILDTLPNVGEE